MSLITQVSKDDLKDASTFVRSISPSAIENISKLLKLQGNDRDVLLLRYRDKKTIEDVASILNISIATVNRTIYRLKRMVAMEIINNNLF